MTEIAVGIIQKDAAFRAAVKRGIAQADRGELLDHEQVVASIRQLSKA